MKLIINIPKEFEEHFNKDKFSDSLARVASDLGNFGVPLSGRYEQETITMLRKAFEDATPLEAPSNRCDSCKHSEERDGSNCYECVKGMADNFESQPKTSYISIDVNKFAKDVAEKALDEITYEGKTLREWAEIIVKQQPCEDCISRSELLRHQHIIYDDDEEGYNAVYVKDIKALPPVIPSYNSIKTELKPCEDCISRQAVLDYAKDTCLDLDKYEDTEVFCDEIKAMPSVKPKYTDEEIDKAQAVEQAYVNKMVELAVEELKRPKGKWIEIFVETPNDPYSYGFKSHKCSKCEYRPLQISNYCPNCGAEMSGGEEDGNSN